MNKPPNSRQSPVSRSATPPKRISEVVSTEHHPLARQTSPSRSPSPPVPPKALATTTSAPHTPARAEALRVSAVPIDDPSVLAHIQAQQKAAFNGQSQTKPVAETNSNYQSVDLPSGFTFYPFKTLSIRPLRGLDQAKLHQAATQNSIKLTVEAISATLGDGISAYDLTPSDFYYLMYWQRTQSFLKTPMVVRASCADPKHNEDVLIGRLDEATGKRVPFPEETLKLSMHVDKTTLEVKNLELSDDELDTEHWPELLGIDLYVETMRDVVFAAENLIDLENLAEAEWLAGYAAFLKPLELASGKFESLTERMDRVRDLTPDQIAELDRYIRTMTSYGVSESAKIKCTECGASTTVLIPFDARSFLPNNK